MPCLLQEWYRCITQLPNAVSQLIQMDESLCQDSEKYGKKYFTWDQLAAACVIDAAVVCETKNVRGSVELHCSERRGQLAVDWNKSHGKTDNVCIITKVNQGLYVEVITAALSLL